MFSIICVPLVWILYSPLYIYSPRVRIRELISISLPQRWTPAEGVATIETLQIGIKALCMPKARHAKGKLCTSYHTRVPYIGCHARVLYIGCNARVLQVGWIAKILHVGCVA